MPLLYARFSLIHVLRLQGEDIKDFINPNSRKSSFATGEPALRNVQHGTIIQLERKGFFRIDKAFVRAGQVSVLPLPLSTPTLRPWPLL